MNKEEKLRVIYEKIADKTLSFGCRVLMNDGNVVFVYDVGTVYGKEVFYWDFGNDSDGEGYVIYTEIDESDHYDKIIGHPVMMGDVLEYIKRGKTNSLQEFISDNINGVIQFWGEYNKPIDEQSEECISFIYSLCKNE